MLCKKGVLKNFAKFTGKHLCQNLFFKKRLKNLLLKKTLWHRCFSVNFAKFLRTRFLKEHLQGLLLADSLAAERFQKVTVWCSSKTLVEGKFLKKKTCLRISSSKSRHISLTKSYIFIFRNDFIEIFKNFK